MQIGYVIRLVFPKVLDTVHEIWEMEWCRKNGRSTKCNLAENMLSLFA